MQRCRLRMVLLHQHLFFLPLWLHPHFVQHLLGLLLPMQHLLFVEFIVGQQLPDVPGALLVVGCLEWNLLHLQRG